MASHTFKGTDRDDLYVEEHTSTTLRLPGNIMSIENSKSHFGVVKAPNGLPSLGSLRLSLDPFPCKAQILLTCDHRMVVSCPASFHSHAEEKSLVKCLFNFCSVRQDLGAPIRLQNVGYVITFAKGIM